jgi:hypothetical protein
MATKLLRAVLRDWAPVFAALQRAGLGLVGVAARVPTRLPPWCCWRDCGRRGVSVAGWWSVCHAERKRFRRMFPDFRPLTSASMRLWGEVWCAWPRNHREPSLSGNMLLMLELRRPPIDEASRTAAHGRDAAELAVLFSRRNWHQYHHPLRAQPPDAQMRMIRRRKRQPVPEMLRAGGFSSTR